MDEIPFQVSFRGIVRRRRKVFLAVFAGVLLTAVAVALALPPVYRSTARVLVEEQQIPQEFVKTTVTSYVEERLQQITQQVMSRATLVDIIKRFNLYPDLQRRQPVDDIVEKMRAAIALKTVSAEGGERKAGRPSAATVAFTLSYEGESPGVVQKVTDTLASLYLNENLKAREQQASNTTAFLQQEVDSLRAQTEALDSQITAFKRAHLGELPEHAALNLQEAGQAARDLERLNGELRMLEERKIYLEGQLATLASAAPAGAASDPADPRQRLKAAKLRLSVLRGTVSDAHPDVKALRKEIRQLEAQAGPADDRAEQEDQLAALRERLSAKSRELGPGHPDVLALRKEVEAVSEALAAAPPAREAGAENPAFVGLKTQLASTVLEIKSLTEERRKLEASAREYEGKIAKAPLVEQNYARLTRDYQTAQRKYDDIMNKLMEAKVSQGMEESQRGERFTIVDPAQYPERPYKPNRTAIALIGFVLALGAGVGLAAALESLDQSVKSPSEVEALTELPVLCAIPLIEEDDGQTRNRVRWGVLLVAAAVVAAAAAAVLVHLFVTPLDVLWFRLQRRLG